MSFRSSFSTNKKKPKVLFYIKNLNGGGAERCVVEVLQSVDHTKFEYKLLLRDIGGDYIGDIRPNLLLDECFTIRPKNSAPSIFDSLSKGWIFKRFSFFQKIFCLIYLHASKYIFKFWVYRAISKLQFSKDISFARSTLYDLIGSHQLLRVRNAILNYNPDIIVSNLLESGSAIVFLAQLSLNRKNRKFSWVAVEQNNTLDRLRQYYPQTEYYSFWHHVTQAVYQEVDQIIAVSNGIKVGLIENFSVCTDKINVIHNPVNLERFKSAHPLSLAQPYILAAGRLHPQKGFDILIEAYAAISHCVNANLIILGKGGEREKLENQIYRLGLTDRVFLPGFKDNLESYMKSANCFVISSRYEGYPLVLIEAMTASCPVISFDCNYGPSEIIDHLKTGLLVSPGNVKELAKAIKQVLTNETLAENLSLAASTKSEEFKSSYIACEYERLFFRLTES